MPPGQQTRETAKKRKDAITKDSKKTFPKSYIRTVTKRVIISMILPNQKLSCSLSNVYVDDY